MVLKYLIPSSEREIFKYTWEARGTKSLIDYILVNSKLVKLLIDTHVYRGAELNSDHYLVMSKFRLYARWNKPGRNKRQGRDEDFVF